MTAIPLLLRYRTAITVAINLALGSIAYVLAFALRFDITIPPHYRSLIFATVPLNLSCKLVGFWACGLFRGSWRYISVQDAEDIVRGNILASGLFLAGMVFTHGLVGFPRAVFLLDMLLCTCLMAGARIAMRLIRERGRRTAVRRIERLALIVGAGSAGITLQQEIERRRRLKLAVAGFVDDDPAKIGLRISGTPVLGQVQDLPAIVAKHEISEVLIAIPSATGATLRRIVHQCTVAGVRHRVLPTLGQLVEGRVMYTQMREVKVDDLLAREPVRMDLGSVRSLVGHKTVLVTGAAGSIGSELCRQLAAHGPESLVLYDRHENGMHALEGELQVRFPGLCLKPVLGDVLLADQLRSVFARYRPDLVFHAAAYKHVAMAEQNVIEAVRNNIFGTRNVAEAAIIHGAKEFVLVSTDKAVRPTSIMGATKRVAEKVVQHLQNGSCRFVVVRFGNVLGSNGSVLPIFREQIARGGPVTVSDAEATRYFMTIPEASQLILQAAALGEGGEVFILEMGQPIRILDLARHMISLSGFEPDEDVPIVFTGLRPGEKLHEELMDDGEEVAYTYHDRMKVLRSAGKNSWPKDWAESLLTYVEAGDVGATLLLLQRLVPGYRPSGFLSGQLQEEQFQRRAQAF